MSQKGWPWSNCLGLPGCRGCPLVVAMNDLVRTGSEMHGLHSCELHQLHVCVHSLVPAYIQCIFIHICMDALEQPYTGLFDHPHNERRGHSFRCLPWPTKVHLGGQARWTGHGICAQVPFVDLMACKQVCELARVFAQR